MENLRGALIKGADGKVFNFQLGPNSDAAGLPSVYTRYDAYTDINNFVTSSQNTASYYTLINGTLWENSNFSSYEIGPIIPSGANINRLILGKRSDVYICDDLGQVFKYNQNLENQDMDDDITTPSAVSEKLPIWTSLSGGVANDICLTADFEFIYVAKSDNKLYKLLAKDGSKSWESDLNEDVTTVSVDASGLSYAGTANGKLVKLNEDGTINWSVEIPGAITTSAFSPNNFLSIGSTDGNVYRIDPSNGSITWKYDTSSKANTIAFNQMDGRMYAGTQDGNIYRLNPDTGEKIWWGIPDTSPRSILSLTVNDFGSISVSTVYGPVYGMTDTIIGG